MVKYFEEGLLSLEDDMENTLDLASFLTTDDGPDELSALEEVGSHVTDPARTVLSAHSRERVFVFPDGRPCARLAEEGDDNGSMSLSDEGEDGVCFVEEEGEAVRVEALSAGHPSPAHVPPTTAVLVAVPWHLDVLLNPEPFANYARANLPFVLPSKQPIEPVDMVARMVRVRKAVQGVRSRLMSVPVAAAAGALSSVGAALAPGEADAETFLAALNPSVQQSLRHPKRPRAAARVCVQIRRTLPKPSLKCPATEVAEAQMVAYGSGGKRSRLPVLQLASFPQASMGRGVRHNVLRNQRLQQRFQSWEEVPVPPSADSGVAVLVTGGVVVGGAMVGPNKDDERGGAAGGSQRRVRTAGCLEWTVADDTEWAGCDAGGSSAAVLDGWPRAARLTPAYDAELIHNWTGE